LWEIDGHRLHQVTLKPNYCVSVTCICQKTAFHELLKKPHMRFIACTEKWIQFLVEAAYQKCNCVMIFAPLNHRNCMT